MLTPEGKQIFASAIHGRGEIESLAQMLADKFPDRLFGQDGRLMWLNEGRLAPVTRQFMSELVGKHFAGVRPTCSSDGIWQVAYHPLNVGGQEATDLVNTVLKKVSVAQSEPKRIPAQAQAEIRLRHRQGEPWPTLAAAYGVDVDAIRTVVAS